MRIDDPEYPRPGRWPLWGIALVVGLALLATYSGYEWMRGRGRIGLAAADMGFPTIGAYLAALAAGGLLERRRRSRA